MWYSRLVVRRRWWVLLGVAAITWAAVSFLPGIATTRGGMSSIVGTGEPAVQAQVDSVRRFGLPLLTRTAVVQRDPEGLNPYTAARGVLLALEVDKETLTSGVLPGRDLIVALPLINEPRVVPGAREANTSIVTYLFANPELGLAEQDAVAREYMERIYGPDHALIGLAGTIPTQVAQGDVIAQRLPLVEVATLAAIALIVGWHFRSMVAPVITLVTAGLGYVLADRAIGSLAALLDVSAPDQLRPIVIALMLGITTDYTIFFLAGLRRRLQGSAVNPGATYEATREYLPIVLTAGLIVSCGLAALLVADSGLFRAFGPGLAITVLVGLGVSITIVPAMLAILGRWVFWPSRFPTRSTGPVKPGGPLTRTRARLAALGRRLAPSRAVRHFGDRRVAAAVVGVLVAVLLVAALPLTGLRSAVSPVDALPEGNPVRVATAAAATGFTPGILSPTGVIVSAPGIAADGGALAELSAKLQQQPGVDIVLGPPDQPLPVEVGLFLAPSGNAARFLVAFDSDPLAATAIANLRELVDAMPRLLAEVGLAGAEVSYAGDTALGLSLVDRATGDLLQVALAVGLVTLLLLVLFLRSLVAPLYLLASSALAVAATLGVTTLVFQGTLGYDGLVFYIPFAAAVLLVALGSDYNVFGVGYVWEEARHRKLSDALTTAIPRSTRAINAAGLALAASFAFVALIPLGPFQQLAFTMTLGVLIDAFLIRTLLVPALISLVGRASGWPGDKLSTPEEPLPQREGSPS